VAATAPAEATKEARRAEIAHAKTAGSTGARSPASRATSSGPSRTCSRWAEGSAIAGATELTRWTIYRIKDDRADAEAILAKWEREAA